MSEFSLPLFDPQESERLKIVGRQQAESRKSSLLEFTRKGLKEIARSRPDRTVTADDAARYLVDHGISVHALGNAAGGLFRGSEWEFTGVFVKSQRVHAHSNPLRLWRLK